MIYWFKIPSSEMHVFKKFLKKTNACLEDEFKLILANTTCPEWQADRLVMFRDHSTMQYVEMTYNILKHDLDELGSIAFSD
jgi:hypothetical protein